MVQRVSWVEGCSEGKFGLGAVQRASLGGGRFRGQVWVADGSQGLLGWWVHGSGAI
jgi:hypothetical protein